MSEIMKNTSVVPDGWSIVSLGDVLQYEQPYYYTVTSDDYNDIAGTPVLTAGKSFLLGYTTEVENVYNNLPVIIFDDFTTDSKFVDFPFKVKSSAMKFLKPKEENVIDLRLIFEFIQKLKISVANADHKRRWISEFSKIKILIPSYPEQQHIAKILSTADSVIEKTQAAIAKYKAIKQGMLQDLFTRGIDLNTNKLRPRYQDAPELYKESKLGMIPWEWDEKIFGEEVDLIHGHQFRDYDFTEFGIPVVKIGQVKPDNVDLSSCSFVAYGREDEFQNEIIRNGDVLMALTGATLGKACLVKGLNGIVLQNYRVGRFEPIIKQNDIDKEFLYYLLIAGDLLTQIFNKVNTGAQGNIGKADFEKATFKKPPFTEQQEIAKRLRAIDNKLQTEQTYLQKMQSLKKGLMEDLLCGKKQVKVTEEVLTQNGN